MCIRDRLLTAEKLWQLGRVSLEDVSPDGKSTVYSVTNYSVATNKGNTDLYIVDNQTKISKKITCLLYTSDAADERSSVDLGGRRIIKKKRKQKNTHNHLLEKITNRILDRSLYLKM